MTNMTHEQLVEQTAISICRAGIGELVFEVWAPEMQEVFLRQARAAIATIAEATKEPTDRMIVGDDDHEGGDDVFPIARGTETHAMMGGVTPEKVWRAMHRISPLYSEKS